jgi:ActR/RegA family two-component response regulator
MMPTCVHGYEPRTVAIIDPIGKDRVQLCAEFQNLGWLAYEAHRLGDARALLRDRRPNVTVCEDDLHRPWISVLKWVAEFAVDTRIVVATAYGSVSSAVRALKIGVSAYIQKPVCASQILELPSVGTRRPSAPELAAVPLSLQRLRWEHINAAIDATGTLSGAAHQLGLDRRSLRRMLSKYPPQR